MVRRIVERIIEVNRLPTGVTATTDRREAFEGARYIINCARIGGLEAFATDIQIPLKYGVDQCVGDTICAGGIMYAQRTIPALLDFCRDIRELAKPDALFLNYSNPMAMNTWACNHYGCVKTVGLCHGVQGAHRQIAEVIGHASGETVAKKDVNIVAAGLNHQTWFIRVRWRGQDMTPRLLEMFEKHPKFR